MTTSDSIYGDGTYLRSNETWHEEDAPWKTNQVLRLLSENAINPSTVCDVGCGAGAVLQCLSENLTHGAMFYGYEISPQAFSICSSKEAHNLKFYLRDILVEPDSDFDVVMAIDVFESIEDCYHFLRLLRTKVRYKIFHMPLDLSVWSVLRGTPIMREREAVGHIHYFTRDIALALLRDTGYTVLDHFYTTGFTAFPRTGGWKQTVRDLVTKLFYSINPDIAVRVLGGCSLMVLAK